MHATPDATTADSTSVPGGAQPLRTAPALTDVEAHPRTGHLMHAAALLASASPVLAIVIWSLQQMP